MNGALKIGVQAAILLGVIYTLAAVVGVAAPVGIRSKDFSLRLGQRQRRTRAGKVSAPLAPWVTTGMGAELIASPGTNVPIVGIQTTNP